MEKLVDNKIKHDGTKRGIANKGFSGMRRVVARFNFPCTMIGNRPQSLTGHIVIAVGNNSKKKKQANLTLTKN